MKYTKPHYKVPELPKVVICSRASGKQFLLNKILEESKEKVIIVRKRENENKK